MWEKDEYLQLHTVIPSFTCRGFLLQTGACAGPREGMIAAVVMGNLFTPPTCVSYNKGHMRLSSSTHTADSLKMDANIVIMGTESVGKSGKKISGAEK